MKKLSFNKKGFSTLEILLSFTLLTITLSVILIVIFGTQSLSIDSKTGHEATYVTLRVLENTRAESKKDFNSLKSLVTNEYIGQINYKNTLYVDDLTECKKLATTSTEWKTGNSKVQKIELSTILTDTKTAIGLGGDCISNPPTSNWQNPTKYATDTINPGKPISMDELSRYVYIGADKSPFFYIASTTYATLNQNSNIFLTFTNGFNLLEVANSIDAVKYPNLGKTFVFTALASTTNQLGIIDVTDPFKPTVNYRRLSNCVTGSYPIGYLSYYFENSLYLITPFTAGPEFHIFNVTNPTSPTEYPIGSSGCRGLELGNSVNDIVVVNQVIGGINKKFAYLATDQISKELRVFNVTNPTSPVEITTANQNLPGAQNGMSVYHVGNKLYFGRQSTPSGPDLYIFDISNPEIGLPIIGSVDIGTGVNAIRVSGKFAFISTPKVNQEFQVWNISNPSNLTKIVDYNFGNIINRGMDYSPDFIYSTGQSSPNFQILYSP